VPSSFTYGTAGNYSPRGTSALSQRSRVVCGHIKAGRIAQIRAVIERLSEGPARVLDDLLNQEVTLVPVPRSSPLVEGALWPPLVIATELAGAGYGKEVRPLLERVEAVAKSSISLPENRPLVGTHKESIRVKRDLVIPEKITLIDDVLTQGRTTLACAELLREAFPQTEVKIFAVLRTQGLQPDIEKLFDPAVGRITGFQSGKTYRDP
jgi:predicted amidophosphoribosyltransferase